jgi:hypothetical protein
VRAVEFSTYTVRAVEFSTYTKCANAETPTKYQCFIFYKRMCYALTISTKSNSFHPPKNIGEKEQIFWILGMAYGI